MTEPNYREKGEGRREEGGRFRMKVCGPSRSDIWKALAAEIGAVYDPGRWYGGERVVAEVGHWQITLDSYVVSTGKTTHVFTRLRAPYRSEERRVGEEGRSRWAPYH